MRFRCAASTLASTLLVPVLTLAQSTVVCHVKTFQASAGSGFTNPLRPSGINRFGNVVGLDSSGKAFLRLSNGRVQHLNINVPNASELDVGKRNASGVTVGAVQSADSSGVTRAHGFANANGKTTLIDFPNANTRATGINRYGTIVGNFASFTGTLGNGSFVLKNGKFTILKVPAKFSRDTEVTANSDTGVIVGNYALQNSPPDPDQTVHGFVDMNGTFKDLAFPGTANNTRITDINASGMITGSLEGSDPTLTTFIYRNGKFFNPKFVFSNGSSAGSGIITGLNGSGQITGILVNGPNTVGGFVGSCTF